MLPESATQARRAAASSRSAFMRRCGPLLEVSADGQNPLPHGVITPILPELEYDHTTLLFGEDAIDRHTGERRGARVERKRLYQFDAGGRLVTGAGYIDKVYGYLKQRGYRVVFVDTTETAEHADVFTPKPARLERHPEFKTLPEDHEIVAAIRAGGPPADVADAKAVAAARRVIQGEYIEIMLRRSLKRMGCVIQLPPGCGKSFAIARLALLLPKAKIVLAVPDVDNFNKSWRHLSKYFPAVGRLGDGNQDHQRITVCTFGSLHWVDDDVDILIVDEAHKAAAESHSKALMMVAHRAVRIGLTATPEGRIDGADAKLEWLFGPVAYRLTWPEAVALGLIVPIAVKWLSAEGQTNPAAGRKGIWRKKLGIWRNQARNAMFARAAKALPDNEQALVMVATIEHAVHIGKMLPDYEIVYGSHDADQFARYADADLLAEDFKAVTPERREALRMAFESGKLKRVIATDVWSTGVSFDALPTLLRADARNSAILDEQIPGRVSRADVGTGKKVGRVVDSLDEFDRGFAAAATARMKNYTDKGWEQEVPGRRRRV
jgi:superfamily II DNA or RNA helicase